MVTTGDSLYCWGGNSEGELGLGFTSRRSTPVLVTGGLTFMVPPRE
jgi:alpha-tubulin suppressor-like RCC1 family protein